ncbi:MAG: hypothetical protein IKS03_00455 [Ruminococcus sp.]|nr:hypothetical protein [Ruminococcus sp.]
MLDELKNYLDVTWTDTATDTKISGILSRAENMINKYAGTEIDFETDLTAKQLLFDLCRYIYCNSLEDFKINFRGDLIALRARYKADDTTAGGDEP